MDFPTLDTDRAIAAATILATYVGIILGVTIAARRRVRWERERADKLETNLRQQFHHSLETELARAEQLALREASARRELIGYRNAVETLTAHPTTVIIDSHQTARMDAREAKPFGTTVAGSV